MGRKRLARLFFGTVIILSSIINPLSVNAKTDIDGITLSPARKEISIKPGTMKSGTLEITNNFSKPVDVELSAEEFNVINQNYDYVFTEDSDIIKWVSFEESVINLAPEETRKIEYYMGVPNNAEPGGRYLSLFVSTEIKNNDSVDAIISKQRVASLLYVNVEGDVSRIGSLVSFNAPWFTTRGGGWSATIRNSGTTHYHSVYSAKLYDLFGNKKWESTQESLILPASIRLVTSKLPEFQLPGVYRSVYKISLGDSPQVEKTLLLFYIPTWFLMSIILIIIVFLIYRFIKKTKLQ